MLVADNRTIRTSDNQPLYKRPIKNIRKSDNVLLFRLNQTKSSENQTLSLFFCQETNNVEGHHPINGHCPIILFYFEFISHVNCSQRGHRLKIGHHPFLFEGHRPIKGHRPIIIFHLEYISPVNSSQKGHRPIKGHCPIILFHICIFKEDTRSDPHSSSACCSSFRSMTSKKAFLGSSGRSSSFGSYGQSATGC